MISISELSHLSLYHDVAMLSPMFSKLNRCLTLFYYRRKGVIVGNDQDGDETVILAQVCMTLLPPLTFEFLDSVGCSASNFDVCNFVCCLAVFGLSGPWLLN